MKSKSTAKAVDSKIVSIYVNHKEILLILAFSILTAIAAQISIPVQPVPFTLQTVAVMLAGAMLGSRNGAYAMFVYLLLGAIGLPVFANFSGGFHHLFGPTGGYLLAFPVAAFLVGLIIEKRQSLFALIVSFFVATALILISGSLYLSLFLGNDLPTAFTLGAEIFGIWALAKIALATAIFYSTPRKYRRLP